VSRQQRRHALRLRAWGDFKPSTFEPRRVKGIHFAGWRRARSFLRMCWRSALRGERP